MVGDGTIVWKRDVPPKRLYGVGQLEFLSETKLDAAISLIV